MATILRKIRIQNFKTIENFEQDFSSSFLFRVVGDNETGKSTVMQAIIGVMTAEFFGAKLLREGTDKGNITAEFERNGDIFHVIISITEKDVYIKVKFSNGVTKETKGDLRDIFQYIDIDIEKFILDSETADGRRRQIEIVEKLMDKDKRDKARELKDQMIPMEKTRTDAYNALQLKDDLLKEKGEPTDEQRAKYKKTIEPDKLAEDLRNAIQEKNEREGFEKLIKTTDNAIIANRAEQERRAKQFDENIQAANKTLANVDTEMQTEIDRIKKQYEEKRQRLNEEVIKNTDQKKAMNEKVDNWVKDAEIKKTNAEIALEEKPKYDHDNITLQFKELETFNREVDKITSYDESKKNFLQAKKDYAQILKEIAEIREEREKLIKDSNLPVEGLTFDDKGLYLNGVEFKKNVISDSQLIFTVTRIIIALNKEAKVFRVSNSNLLAKNMKNIIEFAKENKFMGFFEYVEQGVDEVEMHVYSDGKFVEKERKPVVFENIKETKKAPDKKALKVKSEVASDEEKPNTDNSGFIQSKLFDDLN